MFSVASIIEVYDSIPLKVLANRCLSTLLNPVMGHQKVCTMRDIPRAGPESSLRVISSIVIGSIVSSSIRIPGWTNQERMASLISVVCARLIQQDILAEVVTTEVAISDVDIPEGQVIRCHRMTFTNCPNVARHTEDFTFAFPHCDHISRRFMGFDSLSLTIGPHLVPQLAVQECQRVVMLLNSLIL